MLQELNIESQKAGLKMNLNKIKVGNAPRKPSNKLLNIENMEIQKVNESIYYLHI